MVMKDEGLRDREEMKATAQAAKVGPMKHETKPATPKEHVVADMGKATALLHKETERGEHRPSVGGYHDHNHDGKCESTGCV